MASIPHDRRVSSILSCTHEGPCIVAHWGVLRVLSLHCNVYRSTLRVCWATDEYGLELSSATRIHEDRRGDSNSFVHLSLRRSPYRLLHCPLHRRSHPSILRQNLCPSVSSSPPDPEPPPRPTWFHLGSSSLHVRMGRRGSWRGIGYRSP